VVGPLGHPSTDVFPERATFAYYSIL